jgi:hypothetical protein
MMGIVDQVPLRQQAFHFFRLQALARLDGRLAGHEVQQTV